MLDSVMEFPMHLLTDTHHVSSDDVITVPMAQEM